MKKIFLLLALSISIISCKNTEEKQVENVGVASENTADLKSFKGEFLYLEDAAVLKGDNFIYGVTLDEMAKELADQVESVKKNPYDMVPVFIKGTVKNKSEGTDGWDEIVTIKEIIRVSDKATEADIKIEEKKS
jgi:hypothetical protein